MSKATTEKLGTLHGIVAEELARRIGAGEASAADIGAAIKFLKDNEITADVNTDSHLKGLQEKIAARARNREKRDLRLVPESGPITEAEQDEIKEAVNGGP